MNTKILYIIGITLLLLTVCGILLILGNKNETSLDWGIDYEQTKTASIIREIPEVKEWMALFTQDGQSPNTGGVPILEEVEFKDGIYTIHLYERMDDRIVTFGWFYLDPVKKEIVDSNGRYYESDSWFGI